MFLYKRTDRADTHSRDESDECPCASAPLIGIHLAGRVISAQTAGSLPRLRVTIRTSNGKKTIGKGFTTRRGEFVVALTQIRRATGDCLVVVEDAQGTILARHKVRFGPEAKAIRLSIGEKRLAKAKPVAEECVAPPLLVDSRLEHQARVIEHIFDGISGGDRALAVYHAALRSLFWLAEFYQDAQAVLEGDPAATGRWRLGLLAFHDREWGADSGVPEVRLAPSPNGAFNPDAFSLLVGATAWAALNSADEERLFAGLFSAISPQLVFDQVAALVAQENVAGLRAFLFGPVAMGSGLDDISSFGMNLYSFTVDEPDLGIDIPGFGRGGIPGFGKGRFPGLGGDIPGLGIKMPGFGKKKLKVPKPGDDQGEWPIIFPGVPETCFDRGRRSAARLRDRTPRYLISALSDPHACPGQVLSILGTNFGQSGDVMFSAGAAQGFTTRWVEANIVFWSDINITVVVPPDAISGPLYLRIFVGSVDMCGIDLPVYRNGNFFDFEGGLPTVSFGILGGPNFIEPGAPLILTWSVKNATTFRIRRTSAIGPPCNITDPPGSSFDLGPFTENKQVEATYELTATNGCGTARATVTARLRSKPNLAIAGIEPVQVIQRFSFQFPKTPVRLVARKRTLVRVYLESGVYNNFDYGAGPGKLAGITGELTLWRGTTSIAKVSALNVGTATRGDYIWTRGNQFIDTLPFSLNFELPVNELIGQLRLDISVRAQDPNLSNEFGWFARRDDIVVDFVTRKALRVLVIQVVAPPPPPPPPPAPAPPPPPPVTLQMAINTVARILDRYPLAEDGVDVLINSVVMTTNRDLTQDANWNGLLDELAELSEDFDPNYDVLVGVTPAVGGTTNGIASATISSPPCALVQFRLNATVAHEVAHTFGVGHATSPCIGLADPNYPKDIDARLPAGTEDNGLEIRKNRLIPTNTSELMSYCTPTWAGATYQDRWTSTALWDILFDRFG